MTCMAQFLLPLSFITKVIAIPITTAYWLMSSTSKRNSKLKKKKEKDIKPISLLSVPHNGL